ncbi:unnamed protein product [Meloidogyne enterolobii]|uniref:Uncharacterized protein n=1 Tax=Meloidogyne enterolobii TaxID=390850 RepID=A0ACB1AVY4_MELEN
MNDDQIEEQYCIGKNVVNTAKAPAAIGPYSQAVYSTGSEHSGKNEEIWEAPHYLFLSGQLGIVPSTNEFATGDNPVHAQTVQAMKNIEQVLKAAHSYATFDNIVKTTILLVDMTAFPVVNEAYKQFFDEKKGYPARSCYQVSALPKGGLVEIEAIAALSTKSQNTLWA